MSQRSELHEAIDKLSDKQVELVKNNVDAILEKPDNEDIEELLKIRGIRFGKEMDPDRKNFKPLKVEGELPSEILIRERR